MLLAAVSQLSFIDYVVVLLYLAGTLSIGLLIGRRVKTGNDFFLAGRQLPWWAIGMSLVATDIGGTDIIGVGGAAYKYGIVLANFEWIGCVPAMIVAAFVFVPFFYRSGVYTVPEFLEKRYNAGVRGVMALCWLLFMACNIGVMLYASGKMLSSLFGWNEVFAIVVTGIFVGTYTCAGGLAAVVYTDMIQCAVMIGGCLLVLVLGLSEIGGIGALQEEVIDKGLILPVDTPSPFPWPAIYLGLAFILSPAYWIGNQAIMQRSLGARSEFEAKASYIWGALLKNCIPIIIAVPGLVAVRMFPDLADGDLAFPQLVNALLPSGLRGLFLAAFLAALMSSVDSYLNSAATIASHDVYRRFIRPEASADRLLFIGRSITVAFVIWAIGFAMALTNISEGVYVIFQTLMAFFQGPAFAILLLGVFWRRATGKAAFVGLLAGIATSVSLYALSQETIISALGWEPLFKISEPYLYFSIWAFVVSATLTIIGSLLTAPEPAEKQQYVYRRNQDTTVFKA